MKKLFLLACLFTGLCSGQTVNPDEIVGIWKSNLEKGHVEITRNGDVYSGKIVWLKKPTYPDGTVKIDKNNPDPAKRNEQLMGLEVLKDLVFVNDHWEGGKIYDPESGNTYSCRITYKDGTLNLRGYIGISQIGRTQTWTHRDQPVALQIP
jgi:uncharacterized protein (DUF2147 family)